MNALKKFLRWLRNHLSLNETYVFYGGEPQFMDALQRKEVSASKAGKNKYVFSPLISWGTATGIINSGINVFLRYGIIDDETLRVKLYTNIRPEIWAMVGVFSFIFFSAIVSGQHVTSILLVIILFPACVLWFNLIYKLQEKSLMKKVRKKLGLEEYEGSLQVQHYHGAE
jgi:hypothetical protein